MKYIKDYEGLYSVTEDGKIFATAKYNWKERFLKPWLIGHGYEVVSLYKNGKQRKFLIHRLVAQAYIPNPKGLREVNHKNGNRLDNRVENLEWVSSKENKSHAWKVGLYSHRGEKHWNSVIQDSEVIEMRKLFKEGKSTRQIAEKFSRNYFTTRGIVMERVRHIN